MDYILALDQGTTSSRAIVFDRNGRVVASAQREFRQSFPQPGWVEHDALEIWQSQLTVAQQALAQAQLPASALAGIGITNQRETTVLWDRKTGLPLAPAIVWQDRRTAGRCDALRAAGHATGIQQKTGLVLDAYFSGTKLEWLLDHIPGARQRAEQGELAFGTIDSWLAWKLSDGALHITDASNASRTLLFNIHTLRWDPQLLALLRIPAALLPAVVPSSAVVGHSAAHWLGAAVPLAGMAGDQQAATFGQTCFRPGTAKNTYGTGCFMLMNTGRHAIRSRHQLLSTVAWSGAALGASALDASRSCYALEGSVFMGGATIQWLRDGLQIIRASDQVEALAASVNDVDDVYLVPAFAGLGTPHWDGHARGTLLGMTRGTTRAHIARAALEAIALQSADVFAAMASDSGIALQELRVDGGASRNNLLMQMQADFLGVPVVRPVMTETTALGAAYLAGLATGVWSGVEELTAQWAVDRRFTPQMSDTARRSKRARWQQAVARARAWAQP